MKILFGKFLVGIIIISGCTPPNGNKAFNPGEKEYPVKIQSISKKEVTRTLDFTANLAAFEEVYFAPASPGRIDKIYVDVGDKVAKGQVLIEMDRTQLQQAKIQLQNARSNFSRLDTLYNLESISEQQYEQAKTQYEVSLSNVKFLEDNTTLESPISGIVTERYYESKEMYSGAPNTQVGKAAVLKLMQIDPLKAIVNISERYFPRIKKGMEARLHLDIYPAKNFQGKIYRIHPTVDMNTRTFQAEIIVDNPDKMLRPGMFARVMIELKSEKTIMVPAVSVMQQEGTNKRYIFINNNDTARRVDVKLGKRFNDKVEIISDDIQEGMELVVAGHANLQDGSSLKVIQE